MALLLSFSAMVGCQSSYDAEKLLREQYPKLVLLGFGAGRFTGSEGDEFVAFYEDPRERYEQGKPPTISKVVAYVVWRGKVKVSHDLSRICVSSLGYTEEELQIITNPGLQFGRWTGYAHVGDFNGNGIDQILFFVVGGDSSLPVVVEFNGTEFVRTLDFPYHAVFLTDIRTVNRDGRRFLKLYTYADDSLHQDKREWYLYGWNGETQEYDVIEQGIE